MRVRVYLRPKTILILLARKNKDKEWLAQQVGVTKTAVYLWLYEKRTPTASSRQKIFEAFRGVSHKEGGRLTWDDLFQTVAINSQTTNV